MAKVALAAFAAFLAAAKTAGVNSITYVRSIDVRSESNVLVQFGQVVSKSPARDLLSSLFAPSYGSERTALMNMSVEKAKHMFGNVIELPAVGEKYDFVKQDELLPASQVLGIETVISEVCSFERATYLDNKDNTRKPVSTTDVGYINDDGDFVKDTQYGAPYKRYTQLRTADKAVNISDPHKASAKHVEKFLENRSMDWATIEAQVAREANKAAAQPIVAPAVLEESDLPM